LAPDQAGAGIGHAGLARARETLLVVVEAAPRRVPDAADVDREVGRLDGGRVARAHDLAAGIQDIEDGDRPRVVGVELAAMRYYNHTYSNAENAAARPGRPGCARFSMILALAARRRRPKGSRLRRLGRAGAGVLDHRQ